MVNKAVSVDDLSLSFGTLDAPFALVGPEEYLKPDDWAWQFLRLKGSYQKDYAAALAKNDPNNDSPEGAFWITDHRPERKVRAAELDCRKRYGLSTWLDPQCSRLPKLNPGESWFFPLKQTVDSPVGPSGDVPMEDVFSYYFVPPGQGIGDRRRMGGRKFVPDAPEDRSKIWFAIDCSIPPAGQMTAVEFLAKSRRDWFLRDKQRSHTGSSAVSDVVPLSECQRFKAEKFTKASAVLRSAEAGKVWHALCIDALVSVVTRFDVLLFTNGDGDRRTGCKEDAVEAQRRRRYQIEPLGIRRADPHREGARADCAARGCRRNAHRRSDRPGGRNGS